MKMKDVKQPNLVPSTVGELRTFLSQFPDVMPICAMAQPDAISEEGYNWIFVDVQAEEQEQKEEEDLEVAKVLLMVDH